MKKIFIISVISLFTLISCSENDRMVYTDTPGLYFAKYSLNDSLNFSFTMTKENEEIIQIPIMLLGQTATVDRKFKIAVAQNTTAEQNKHYKPLEGEYTMPAGAISVSIPITFYKTADLDNTTVALNISIVETETFTIGFEEKSVCKIKITNQLIKPSYWDEKLEKYFGVYSKIKHVVCIDLMKHDFPLLSIADYQYYMRQGRKAAEYFALNDVHDENGDLIETWSPF